MSDWKPASDIASIRTELRNAIFWTAFQAIGQKLEGRKEQHDTMQQGACSFVEFGIRSGLLEPSEGNEWMDAIWHRNGVTLAGVKCRRTAITEGHFAE